MTPFETVAIVLAGCAAGAINTIVGSGSLITFPTLLAFGYPPVVANVSNTLGLVPGSLSGAFGYRRELEGQRDRGIRLGLTLGVYLTGIYGGYFGAAQGVILISLLGIFLSDGLQRLNGLKNVLAALINGAAAVLFILLAPVDYRVALLLAIGSVSGGQLGAYVGRRLPPLALRGVVIAVGTLVALKMLAG